MKTSLSLNSLVPAAALLLAVGLHAAPALPESPNKVAPLRVGSSAPTQVLQAADGPFDLAQAIKVQPRQGFAQGSTEGGPVLRGPGLPDHRGLD